MRTWVDVGIELTVLVAFVTVTLAFAIMVLGDLI